MERRRTRRTPAPSWSTVRVSATKFEFPESTPLVPRRSVVSLGPSSLFLLKLRGNLSLRESPQCPGPVPARSVLLSAPVTVAGPTTLCRLRQATANKQARAFLRRFNGPSALSGVPVPLPEEHVSATTITIHQSLAYRSRVTLAWKRPRNLVYAPSRRENPPGRRCPQGQPYGPTAERRQKTGPWGNSWPKF